jgi:hypothetical protein
MLEEVLKKADFKDVLIVLIGSLSIVAFWRGAWNLLDKYFVPNNFLWSQVFSIIAGVIVLVLISRVGGWNEK